MSEQQQQQQTEQSQQQQQQPAASSVPEELKPFIKDGKILGKYANPVEAIKALEHAQSLIGKRQEPAAPIASTPKVEPVPEVTLDNYRDILKKAGLSDQAVLAELRGDGKLSPSSQKSLEDAGIPKAVQPIVASSILTALEAQQVKVQQAEKDAATKVFGNHDSYLKATQDAARLLDETEKTALNALLTNPATLATGMYALKAAVATKSGGDTGSTIKPTGQPTGGQSSGVSINSLADAQSVMARAQAGDKESQRQMATPEFNAALRKLSKL